MTVMIIGKWRIKIISVFLITVLVLGNIILTVLVIRKDHVSATPLQPTDKPADKLTDNDSINIKSSDLLHLHSILIDVWRHSRGDKARKRVLLATNKLESIIGHKPQIVMPFNDRIMKSKYICPEEFKGTTYGVPFYDKGFEMKKCEITKPLYSFFSILIDFSNMSQSEAKNIIMGIRENYKQVSVYISSYQNNLIIFLNKHKDEHLKIIYHKPTATTGEIWKELLENSNTEFVLIARDILRFDAFDARIERLIRVIDELGVTAAAGARRNVKDGLWSKGCYQSALKNYTLSYQEGYDRSAIECLFCDYVTGPFVIRRSSLLNVDLKPLQGDAFFRHLFLTLQLKNQESIVCPDSMFYTNDYIEKNQFDKNSWISFAQHNYLNRIKFNSNEELHFSCEESNVKCNPLIKNGLAHPPCCLEQLSYAIKTFMQICENAGIICELQSGATMGSVKLNKILPWDWDADLTFLTANFSALADYTSELSKAGISVTFDRHALWCCADGVMAGGTAVAYYKDWTIELYGQHRMDSEVLLQRGLSPTRLFYSGTAMNVPRNPGLHARNRYGHFIYGHIEHWITLNKPNQWLMYVPTRFLKCTSFRTYNCLDQYFTDGSIQFNDVIP